jgi:hypothetical protein
MFDDVQKMYFLEMVKADILGHFKLNGPWKLSSVANGWSQ